MSEPVTPIPRLPTCPIRLVDAFLPSLLERPSVIVNVSSGLARVPDVAAPVHSGAKAFVHAWTVALRAQLTDTSLRVVELLPPVTDTPLADEVAPGSAPRSSGSRVCPRDWPSGC